MLKKTWEQIAVPFSKGIVIGSYNNCNHRVSDESVRELPEQDGENYEE